MVLCPLLDGLDGLPTSWCRNNFLVMRPECDKANPGEGGFLRGLSFFFLGPFSFFLVAGGRGEEGGGGGGDDSRHLSPIQV